MSSDMKVKAASTRPLQSTQTTPSKPSVPTALSEPAAPNAGWAPKAAKPAPAAAPLATPQETLTRLKTMNETLAKAKTTGTFGTKVANALTGGALGSAANARDQVVANTNTLHQRLLEKDGGKLSQKSANILNGAIDNAMAAISDISDIRKGVVKTTADLGTNIALVVAAPMTGGASLAGAATLGAVGAGAKVALKGSMEGQNYGGKDALQDAVSGGAAGVAQGVGSMVKVTAAGASVGNAVAARLGTTAGRLAAGAANGAINSGVSGAVSGGAEKAADFSTWKNGAGAGLGAVALEAGKKAAIGAVVGGVVGAAMNAKGRVLEVEGAPGKTAAAPAPKPATADAAPKPADAPKPTDAPKPAAPPRPTAAPRPPPAPVAMDTAERLMAGEPKAKDMVVLRQTYETIKKNAANGHADDKQMALGMKLKEFFKPVGDVTFEGRAFKMGPEFGTTASARMDAAAANVEAALAKAQANPAAYGKAVDELRAAQRQHLEGDGLLQPLFQELDMLERRMKSGGDAGTRDAVLQLRTDVANLLRTHAATIYGADF